MDIRNRGKKVDNKGKALFGTAKHYKVKITKAKENPVKFILSVLSYALFILLLLIGIALFIYVADIKIREAKGEVASPKFAAYVVLTGSMEPKIKINDVVVTKKINVEDIKVGDIITFISDDSRFSGIIITHRVNEVFIDQATGKYSFETQGDNNPSPDFVLTKGENVLGEVIFKIPKLGYAQQLLASKGGWIIAILIPCLAVLSYDIFKLVKMVGQKKKVQKIK